MTLLTAFTSTHSILDWQSNRQSGEYWWSSPKPPSLLWQKHHGLIEGCSKGQSDIEANRNEMKVLLAFSNRSNVWSVSRAEWSEEQIEALDLNPRQESCFEVLGHLMCPPISGWTVLTWAHMPTGAVDTPHIKGITGSEKHCEKKGLV